MKTTTTFLFLFLLFFLPASAQEWQIFYSSRDAFFRGSMIKHQGKVPGVVRAFHTDSVRLSGMDSVFHLFKTLREDSPLCFSVNAPCWLGDSIIIGSNGDNVLFDENNDSIIIRPQTPLNGSFVMYRFQSNGYMEGEVTAVVQGTVLGIADSIKTIRLQARNNSGQQIYNQFNGISFSVSKSNGMVSSVIWKAFPLQQDTFLYTVANEKRLTQGDVHDFAVGDVLQFRKDCYGGILKQLQEERVILEKWFSAGMDTVYYRRKISMKHITNSGAGLDSTMDTHIDTLMVGGLSTYLFHGKFPEQSIPDTIQKFPLKVQWHDYIMQSGDPYNGRTYLSYDDNRYIPAGNCFESVDGPVGAFYSAIPGCGTFFRYEYDHNVWPWLESYNYLTYYKKGADEYGSPAVISSITKNESAGKRYLNVFPNPVHDVLSVDLNNSKAGSVVLTNMLGEIVMEKEYESHTGVMKMDIGFLQPGVYFINNGNTVVKVVKF
jgi:hypothetical protein